jgi:hypothetical protein
MLEREAIEAKQIAAELTAAMLRPATIMQQIAIESIASNLVIARRLRKRGEDATRYDHLVASGLRQVGLVGLDPRPTRTDRSLDLAGDRRSDGVSQVGCCLPTNQSGKRSIRTKPDGPAGDSISSRRSASETPEPHSLTCKSYQGVLYGPREYYFCPCFIFRRRNRSQLAFE